MSQLEILSLLRPIQVVSLTFNRFDSPLSMLTEIKPDKCDKTVTDKRPVNLDLGTIDMPLPAIASITHRITGLLLVAGTAILLWLLDESLASAEGFNTVAVLVADSMLCKLIIWGVLAALIYHSVAGVKHLIMDMGYGETLEGGQIAAKLVFIISALLIVLVGALIW